MYKAGKRTRIIGSSHSRLTPTTVANDSTHQTMPTLHRAKQADTGNWYATYSSNITGSSGRGRIGRKRNSVETAGKAGKPKIDAPTTTPSKTVPPTIPVDIVRPTLTRTPAIPRTARPGTDARIITWFVIARLTVASPAPHHKTGLAEKPARSITHSDVASRSVWMV